MSGHSHWHSIKYKKGLADSKKSKAFSKISKEISVAAKEGGSDLNFNPKLKFAIEKAKSINLPSEKIEHAIKRGTGEIEEEKLESVLFEAYGPGGVAILIEGITDNKNRTLGEVKKILTESSGKIVEEGAVKWMFEKKGCIIINVDSQAENLKNKEIIELMAIEAGAEDILWQNNFLNVYIKLGELEEAKKYLEEKGIKIESASLDWVAKEKVVLNEKIKNECQKLFEVLDENENVQEIYSNLKL